MSFRTLSLAAALLLGTALLAFATPAQAVDIDCRRDVQAFCMNGGDFCIVWISNPSAWACIGTHTIQDVTTTAFDARMLAACAPGGLACASAGDALALLP